VATNQPKKGRHIPNRMCVGCHEVMPKRALIRIVRTPDGVFIDQSGKLNGRGAYLHDQLSCWAKGLRGPLAGALRAEFSEADRERLAEYAATLKPTPMSAEDSA
jgi:predicted RNA-binding protein YlxR (DUF448 family)